MGLLAATLLAAPTPARADSPMWALDAHVQTGADPDATVIARFLAGGMYVLTDAKLAFEGHVSFAGFLRINDDEGISARSISPINLGARYSLGNAKFHGPYVALGAGFGFFGGSPRERRVTGEMELCANARTETPGSCGFNITQELNTRLGFGYGFPSGKKTTVGVRLDVTYFMFNVAAGEDQPSGAPVAADVPKPQGTVALMLGLEFLRWL
jgi:hypothetical protein